MHTWVSGAVSGKGGGALAGRQAETGEEHVAGLEPKNGRNPDVCPPSPLTLN